MVPLRRIHAASSVPDYGATELAYAAVSTSAAMALRAAGYAPTSLSASSGSICPIESASAQLRYDSQTHSCCDPEHPSDPQTETCCDPQASYGSA
eukprot:2384880-Rhodomonas_salina.1